MSNNSFTVPSLNLTSSRSRKNIPTKDLYQSKNNYYEDISNNGNQSNEKKTLINFIPYQTRNIESRIISEETSLLPPKPKFNEGRKPVYLKN